MLKATADGGEQRVRERNHYEEQIREKEALLNSLKDRLIKKDQDIAALVGNRASLEGQISNLKMERDRLLEVSKNLRIQMNRAEKQQVLAQMRLSDPEAGSSNLYASQASSNRIASKNETRGVSSNGKQEKQDSQMRQLHQEVNDMKKLMNSLKKGGAIGELFGNQANDSQIHATEPTEILSHKAQRLEELRKQRQVLNTIDEPQQQLGPSVNQSTLSPSFELSKISQYQAIQKSLHEIKMLKESAFNQDKAAGLEIDQSVLTELNQRERDLNAMLENFQPNLNMFGSNVFTSIESALINSKDLAFTPDRSVASLLTS
jgi:hypothetical protein